LRILFISFIALLIASCSPVQVAAPDLIDTITPSVTPRVTPGKAPASTSIKSVTPTGIVQRTLPQIISWQIQYTGQMDIDLDVGVFNLDLFDTSPSMIEELHRRGIFVMCYFSAGSYEDWRPDTSQFSPEVLGKDMEGWPGEKWLDIRRMDLLSTIMEERLDLAVQKRCDGVDPDNVNGYVNDTGFPLTARDQLVYNIFLSETAHQRSLAIGLKNDLDQAADLVPYFDWIINEECFSYQECHLLQPFIDAGKPVFVIEYELEPEEFCTQANQMGFNALVKNWELDAYRVDCRQ